MGREEIGGEKAHLKWRRSWGEEREAGKGRQCHSFSSQTEAVYFQTSGIWLLVPCVPKLDSLAQHSVLRRLPRDNHLLLLFPFSTPCFPLAPFHTPFFFLRKTFPKFKTLSWNRGEGE